MSVKFINIFLTEFVLHKQALLLKCLQLQFEVGGCILATFSALPYQVGRRTAIVSQRLPGDYSTMLQILYVYQIYSHQMQKRCFYWGHQYLSYQVLIDAMSNRGRRGFQFYFFNKDKEKKYIFLKALKDRLASSTKYSYLIWRNQGYLYDKVYSAQIF